MKKVIIGLACLILSSQAYSATCKISEYDTLATDSAGREIPVAKEPSIAVQTVTYTTSTASAVFNSATRYVRIVCDAKAHFNFTSGSANATANSPYLAADTPEYFGVRGPGFRVEFYDGTSL